MKIVDYKSGPLRLQEELYKIWSRSFAYSLCTPVMNSVDRKFLASSTLYTSKQNSVVVSILFCLISTYKNSLGRLETNHFRYL